VAAYSPLLAQHLCSDGCLEGATENAGMENAGLETREHHAYG